MMMTCRWLAAVALLVMVSACDDDSSTPDVLQPDAPVADGGPDGPAPDGPARDGPLAVDAPAKPTGWYPVTGVAPTGTFHTATLLDDGRVLVTGGDVEDPAPRTLKQAWIYDPASSTFAGAGEMGIARVFHTATLLPDGKVLVVGGENENDDALASTEIFDPGKPAASAWSAGPALPGPRTRHVAVRLDSGEVLIAGGVDLVAYPFVVLDSLAIYSPQSGSFKLPAAALQQKRYRHAACLLTSGKVLLAGGYDSDYLDSLEIYDPGSGTGTLLTVKLSYARIVPTLTRLKSGQVLIVGGSAYQVQNDELYDPATNTVKPLSHPGGPPAFHQAVLLNDGRVLVVGGQEANPSGGISHMTKSLAYDPAGGGAWVPLPDLNVGRVFHTATLLKNGTVLAVGGQFGKSKTFVNTAELFYP